MPNNLMTTQQATLTATLPAITVTERDRVAWEYRQAGMAWAQIAARLGMARESTARTAANRHAARIGERHGHVANRAQRRAAGARTATPRQRARTIGVEIEFVTATKRQVARAIAEEIYPGANPCRVYGIHIARYHGETCQGCNARMGYRYWKVEADASVDNRTEYGGEVVSPVLRGEAGIDQMKRVMKAIRSVGGEVDGRCGFHVHVGADNMTNAQRATLIETLMTHHGVLDRLVAKSRLTNTYCRKPSDVEFARWAAQMRLSGEYGFGDKYRSINVAKFPVIGTIEVRLHQGTLNGRKAAAWVNFLLGIFNAAAQDKTERLAPGLALLGSLAETGLMTQADAAYLMARAENLAVRAGQI